MKRVYLSGRMSGLPHYIWGTHFALSHYSLLLRGYKVVNPAKTIIAKHPLLYRILGYRFTLWYDLRLLRRCDYIYMVGTGWQQSRGARLERLKARQWGIKEMK